MIAPGNHWIKDSLRGAPPPGEAMGAPAPEVFRCVAGRTQPGAARIHFLRIQRSMGYTSPQSRLSRSIRSMTAMDSLRGMEAASVCPARIRAMASRIWYS